MSILSEMRVITCSLCGADHPLKKWQMVPGKCQRCGAVDVQGVRWWNAIGKVLPSVVAHFYGHDFDPRDMEHALR